MRARRIDGKALKNASGKIETTLPMMMGIPITR
jgi:hypothetical protein